ncbi:hypothetical protein [Paracoccus xiamenensis]|uniref:hypothetical protein n=1 Tax=Paracoccus xiamenensis TaxID=2714901 RepID=UPI00140CA738|nr:hypothetical protein [Paracoccus xiamenensis]NHF71855.1 hypothetical protein [Paracoccus xiamenensis]
MYRFVAALPLFSLLAACSSSLEITQPPVAYKTVKQLPAQSYRGDAETTIRTRTKTNEGTRELAGASCTLSTTYTESQFQTPARVLTPNLGPATPTAHLKCSTGERAVQKNLSSHNISMAERSSKVRASGAGAGIIGAVVSGIVAGVNEGRGDQPTDVHGYASTTLDMSATADAGVK